MDEAAGLTEQARSLERIREKELDIKAELLAAQAAAERIRAEGEETAARLREEGLLEIETKAEELRRESLGQREQESAQLTEALRREREELADTVTANRSSAADFLLKRLLETLSE